MLWKNYKRKMPLIFETSGKIIRHIQRCQNADIDSHDCNLFIHFASRNIYTHRILELGSGTGLVGMLVSKLGPPSCVALTDGDEQAMSLLQNNLQNPFNAIDSNIAKSTFLYWGNAMQPFHDWCQNSWPNVFQDSQVRFDILVAGDVMYKKELPGLFFQTVDSLLNKNGVLWLCHVPRSTVTHQYMMKAANDAGFTIQTHETSSLEVTNCPKDDLVRAVVYRIKR